MKHKDAHWHSLQSGMSISAHHAANPVGEHSDARLGEGDLHPTTAGEVGDIHWDALWIDIGGEG